jgi:hypothetical protein
MTSEMNVHEARTAASKGRVRGAGVNVVHEHGPTSVPVEDHAHDRRDHSPNDKLTRANMTR